MTILDWFFTTEGQWIFIIGLVAFFIYWKIIKPKSIRNASIFISFVVSLIIFSIFIIPLGLFLDALGQVPDWIATCVAFLIIGIFIWFWKYLTIRFGKKIDKLSEKLLKKETKKEVK